MTKTTASGAADAPNNAPPCDCQRCQSPGLPQPLTITCDPASPGSDVTVISYWRDKELLRVRRIERRAQLYIAHVLEADWHHYQPQEMKVNPAGIGAGILDYLKAKGVPAKSWMLNVTNDVQRLAQLFNSHRAVSSANKPAPTSTVVMADRRTVLDSIDSILYALHAGSTRPAKVSEPFCAAAPPARAALSLPHVGLGVLLGALVMATLYFIRH